jgi:hypothetical protein
MLASYTQVVALSEELGLAELERQRNEEASRTRRARRRQAQRKARQRAAAAREGMVCMCVLRWGCVGDPNLLPVSPSAQSGSFVSVSWCICVAVIVNVVCAATSDRRRQKCLSE